MLTKGNYQEQFQAVKDAFEELHATGRETGSSFAVYQDGIPLIDIWGGHRDKEKKLAWEQNTLANVWSTTKGVAATCVALMVEKGLLDYNAKVAEYWPEFGVNGKEDITVGMLLSHQAGICGTEDAEIDDYYSHESMSKRLENMTPIWEPGTASGYHSMTYGWLAGELVLRVSGKSLGTILKEEITSLRDIDFHIGLDKSEHHRCAEMIPMPRKKRDDSKTVTITDAQKATALGPNTLKHQNTSPWKEAEIPAANGQGSAQSLAKFYSLIVPKDKNLQILKDETIVKMTKTQIENRDLVLSVVTRWAAGFIMNKHKVIYGPIPESFGHSGWGGSCAFADPVNQIGISYVMNQMEDNVAGDMRSVQLINKLYECLKES